MGFIYLAFRNMLRHRTRTVLTLISILVAVGVLFAVISYNRSFFMALEREMRNTGVHIFVVPTGCPHEAASLLLHGGAVPRMLDRDDLAAIEELVGDRAQAIYPMLIAQARNMAVDRLDVVYGLERNGFSEFKPNWRIAHGGFPDSGQEVVLGFRKAEQLGLQVGDIIEYQVKGRLKQEVSIGDFKDKLDDFEDFFLPESGLVLKFKVAGILDKTGTQDDGSCFCPFNCSLYDAWSGRRSYSLGNQT
jgi:ABC-type lipoprotein release transport system permease subunit